ncbi:MAG: D-alanyl-D-alanine carboxypeptidase/D-alanyl-D-alanine-endopeptidase [Actinomycetota bacterium]|nr:D-alanyl-D-alanine carboxypeptidase/D-alanyl-D-alanine-endopeptidase [Actinomycetota bacterium]
MKRYPILIALLASLAAAAPTAAADRTLPAKLARALAVPHVSPGRTGAIAVDLATGRLIFDRNAALALAPASTEKLTLSYALLATVGPAYRLETEVRGAGTLDGETWRGDLVLKGYGDPTLRSGDLRALARRIRARGIRAVTGGVVGDESHYDSRRTGPGWKASFYREESPPLSALSVDRTKARRPALVTAQLFSRALKAAGVRVARAAREGRAPEEAELLALDTSPALLAILREVNRDSDNFTAEMLLKHLGALERGRGTSGAGAAAVRVALAEAGVPLAGVRIADGSGLSRLDRLTAGALAALLVAAWKDQLLRTSFLSTLAVSGVNGTLEDRLERPPVRGKVFAKTGTTKGASALAGYVGARYAFAILTNGSPVSYWWCRRAQDRFVTVLAAP